jgi:hypothetical protein
VGMVVAADIKAGKVRPACTWGGGDVITHSSVPIKADSYMKVSNMSCAMESASAYRARGMSRDSGQPRGLQVHMLLVTNSMCVLPQDCFPPCTVAVCSTV